MKRWQKIYLTIFLLIPFVVVFFQLYHAKSLENIPMAILPPLIFVTGTILLILFAQKGGTKWEKFVKLSRIFQWIVAIIILLILVLILPVIIKKL